MFHGTDQVEQFRRAVSYVDRILRGDASTDGVIESVGRYREISELTTPTRFAQFTERVPMVKGRLDVKASTATGYARIVWDKGDKTMPRLMWVPPCRKKLERVGDY